MAIRDAIDWEIREKLINKLLAMDGRTSMVR